MLKTKNKHLRYVITFFAVLCSSLLQTFVIESFVHSAGLLSGSRLPCFAPFFQLLQSLQEARHFLKAHSIHIVGLSFAAGFQEVPSFLKGLQKLGTS